VKVVIFGLTISSAWGNGHATLWRGLCGALHARGHDITFFERDVPYYARNRDLVSGDAFHLVLYDAWGDVRLHAARELAQAEVAIVTSYCPDGPAAAEIVLQSRAMRKVFYDLDSPVTLDTLARGERVPYLPADGLAAFDLVLSYAGGRVLQELKERLGAQVVAPLYGSVDPAVHRPVPPSDALTNDLSYLGTYAADRQQKVEGLFITPARLRPHQRFALAGAQYPPDFPWTENILYFWHLPPHDHATLFCSSRLTLNTTRSAMAAAGYCPSGRLFEAAACGAAIVTDWWDGLGEFFEPAAEVLVAHATGDVLAALDLPAAERARIGRAARERALACHTASVRARELEMLLEPSWCGQAGAA